MNAKSVRLPVDEELVWQEPKEEERLIERLLSTYEGIKRILDVVLSLVGLVVSLPVFLICPLLIRLTSKGAAYYTQYRIGRNGMPLRFINFEP